MFIVPYTSESGDHFLFGPFDDVPTHEEVLEVFQDIAPDEADYIEEMVDDGMWGADSPFYAYRLPDDTDEPGSILIGSSEKEPCPI